MVKKKVRRSKHVPQRTCVGCREVLPKRVLIRVVNGPEGVMVDLTGKAHGRGAYLHDERSCWDRGIKGALDHALRTKLTDQEKQALLSFIEGQLAEENLVSQGAEERHDELRSSDRSSAKIINHASVAFEASRSLNKYGGVV
jgi:uncharacterized protein